MRKINDALPKKQERKKQEKEKTKKGEKKERKERKKEKRKKKEKGKEAQSFSGTTDMVAEGLGLLEVTA